MQYKVFDVVLLKNGNKATIIEVDRNHYKAEMVNDDGKTEGIIQIIDKDIKDCIFKK